MTPKRVIGSRCSSALSVCPSCSKSGGCNDDVNRLARARREPWIGGYDERLLRGDRLAQLLLDAEGRAVAVDAEALGRDAVVREHRDAPQLVPAEQLVVARVQQDRPRRQRAGLRVMVEAAPDELEHLGFERGHLRSL